MKTSRSTSFDGWVLRADVGELAKGDRKIRLQQHPLLVLEALLADPGELVTREQLIARLWPKGVVDFDTGLNTAVRKLRVALDDVGEEPRYIETLPRKGYRFIGKIGPPPDAEPQPVPRRRMHYAIAVGLAVLACGLLFKLLPGRNRETASPAPTATPGEKPRTDSFTIALLPLTAASTAEPDEMLAKIVGELLRQHLGRFDNAIVIGSSSAPRSGSDLAGLRRFGASVHARYLLDGSVERRQDRLHVALALLDGSTGARLWSLDETRPESELSGVLDDVVAGVADHLHVHPRATPASASRGIDLAAYEIYVRAQELMANQRVVDTESALQLFRRATVLDPEFARAYLGLAQAQVLLWHLRGADTTEAAGVTKQAHAALDRALTLDPGLGEVFIERARLAANPVEAEQLYLQGLALSPNYGYGHLRYAEFLFEEYRRGEAIAALDRARAIDPLNPRLHMRQAMFRMVTSSDVAAHDRLMQEALSINPKLVGALLNLAMSRDRFSGEFADGIRLLEQAIQLDPQRDELKIELAGMYLDVDDPDAAIAVLKQVEGAPKSRVEIAQYQHDRRRAAQLARAVPTKDWRTAWEVPEASALRDEAIATRDFSLALDRIGTRFAESIPGEASREGSLRMWDRGLNLLYAHTLVCAGETQRGRKLALTILAQLDSESIGRAPSFLSQDRAAAYMILGDKERALGELKESLRVSHYSNWWYLGDLDPLYEGVRADPRFQALVAQAKQHRVRQHALLDELRRKGQVPTR